MPAPTRDAVLAALAGIQDPELHRDIVALHIVREVEVSPAGDVTVTVRLDAPAPGRRAWINESVRAAVSALPGVQAVRIEFSAGLSLMGGTGNANPKKAEPPPPPQAQARAANPLPHVKHIIAVGAGKGGVGKSTVSVNLAVALARAGKKVGLLDGDIYGPSVPTMLGLAGQPNVEGQVILPFEAHGLRAMSVGNLVAPEQALIWRGPMAHGAFRQLATQTRWGVLDYLFVDLPPGTGDVPLTLAQTLPMTGAVVVCTPQKVAQDDARRAVAMFRQLGIEVIGLVENMSYFIGDDGKEYDLFGRGGAEKLALETGVPFLGAVPINIPLRKNSDAGTPLENFQGALGRDLDLLAQRLIEEVHVMSLQG